VSCRAVSISHIFSLVVVDYLFGSRKRIDPTSKFDQILKNLYELLMKHPDYKIYVTGHSLGGALSHLLAFKLAALEDSRINQQPITCLTIASPRVGNLDFRRAFQVNLSFLCDGL
jgi:predicted lipase